MKRNQRSLPHGAGFFLFLEAVLKAHVIARPQGRGNLPECRNEAYDVR